MILSSLPFYCVLFMPSGFSFYIQSVSWSSSRVRPISMASSARNSEASTSSVSSSRSKDGGLFNRNLKDMASSPGLAEINPLLENWNRVNGLSDRELIESSISNSQRQSEALALAYKRCEYVTKTFSKTFYMGTSLMRPDARAHVWAIYAWCRRTDDIVDSPRALLDREVLSEDLAEWDSRLNSIWRNEPQDVFDLAMSDTVKAYPTLSVDPFRDMVKGMVMDIPGLGQDRYKNFEELYLYCYRVAGTVGLMTLPILGTAKGYTEAEAVEPAVALGIALQLTNILRDVGEDLERGRIYLPQDELAQFGLTEQDLFACKVTDKYKEFMKFQIQRARDYYARASTGIPMLAPDGRLAVQASLDLYGRILSVIERNDYDNFNKRAYTTKLEKLTILPQSYLTMKKLVRDAPSR